MENDLARRFAKMSDDELREHFASARLDESALALLTEELNRRGLLLDAAGQVANTEAEAGAVSVSYRMLVRGLTPLHAQILLGRLQADGVDAHLSGANVTQVDPLWFYALGGVRIFVRMAHLAHAFDVINATAQGDYEVKDADEEDVPGVNRIERKRLAGWMIVLLVAFVMGGTTLVVLWCSSDQDFSHLMAPEHLFGRWMASAALVVYAVFWLVFVECAVERQRRP
jgi:hypothetical protein